MDGSSLLSWMCCLIWRNIPTDLIIEVLCRLPDKSLIQFKCVSKDWNFFITNICVPRLAASAPISAFLFMPDVYFNSYFVITSERHKDAEFFKSCTETLPFRQWEIRNVGFIGCFHGLVLICKQVVPEEFYVCNPATRQCVSIPMNPHHRKNSIMSLAFNPHNNTYKIVRIPYSSESSTKLSDFEVFSSVTGKWGSFRIPLDPRIIRSNWLPRFVYLNENLYALSNSGHLLCFDLHDTDGKKLRASAIELPIKAKGQHIGLISLSNECLYHSRVHESILHIWLLEAGRNNATSAWVPWYTVNMDKLRQLPCGEHLSPSFLPFEIDLASDVIYLGNQRVVLKYNLRTNKLELFHQMEEGETILNGTSYYPTYKRSLVMLPYFSA